MILPNRRTQLVYFAIIAYLILCPLVEFNSYKSVVSDDTLDIFVDLKRWFSSLVISFAQKRITILFIDLVQC